MDDRTETLSFGLVGDRDRDIGLSRRPVVGVSGLTRIFTIYTVEMYKWLRFFTGFLEVLGFKLSESQYFYTTPIL